jgi:hypothetical protein
VQKHDGTLLQPPLSRLQSAGSTIKIAPIRIPGPLDIAQEARVSLEESLIMMTDKILARLTVIKLYCLVSGSASFILRGIYTQPKVKVV